MQYPKSISELLRLRHKGLTELERRVRERQATLDQLKAVLPADLAGKIATAGLDGGRLSIGVTSAAWASRLRYMAPELRRSLGEALGVKIDSVKIRVARSQPRT